MGSDQIFIETAASADVIGPEIAEMYRKRYYEDGTIWIDCHRRYGFWRALAVWALVFALGLIVSGLMGFIVIPVTYSFVEFWAAVMNSNNFWLLLIVSIVAGVLTGFTARLTKDEEWMDVTFDKSRKNKTQILIRRFDEEGCRNFNEKQIHDMISVVEDHDKEAIVTGL